MAASAETPLKTMTDVLSGMNLRTGVSNGSPKETVSMFERMEEVERLEAEADGEG